MRSYKQLTTDDRYTIAAGLRQGLSQAEIARLLGRHRSTIGREISRNLCIYDGAYRAAKADQRTRGRRSRARQIPQFCASEWRRVERYLRQDWSPEQIANYLRENDWLSISHETIYKYIWNDKRQGGDLYKHLRQSSKQRRKRYRSYDSRGILPNKLNISQRPLEVELRKVLGHWEIDTVIGTGSKDCIVTLVERTSGYTLIGKLPNKTTASLNQRVISLIKPLSHKFKTITADNGTEFHAYKKIENSTNVTFYFANPYHSWERGTNENTNGLIRQYLPKGTSMASLTQKQCNAIANKLNSRPRKRLGFKTPNDVFFGSNIVALTS